MAEMIEYTTWLRELAANSDYPFVRDSETMIQYFFELDRKLPLKYSWRVTSPETFNDHVGKMHTDVDLNRHYWIDLARSIEAYGIMVVWRATELFRSTLHTLNAREILPPAVLSRALLELAATFIVNSNTIQENIKDIVAKPRNGVYVSSELEELVVRIIFGSRLGETPEYLKQKNVLTYIQFVSKNPNASDLLPIYEWLCDLTHPNLLGNARFWAAVETKNGAGSETLRMERLAESKVTTNTREKILWALGWSAFCIRNGFEIGQNAVKIILQRWPDERKDRN